MKIVHLLSHSLEIPVPFSECYRLWNRFEFFERMVQKMHIDIISNGSTNVSGFSEPFETVAFETIGQRTTRIRILIFLPELTNSIQNWQQIIQEEIRYFKDWIKGYSKVYPA